MCVGLPRRITAIDGIAGTAEGGDAPELIDLSLTPDARVGDWVLTFLGTAREVIAADEAARIAAALDALRAVMQGRPQGDAFADLDTAGPRLPAHLQAARDAGRTTG